MDSPRKRNDLLRAADSTPKEAQFPHLALGDMTIPFQARPLQRQTEPIGGMGLAVLLRRSHSYGMLPPPVGGVLIGIWHTHDGCGGEAPADERPATNCSGSGLDIRKGMSMMLAVST